MKPPSSGIVAVGVTTLVMGKTILENLDLALEPGQLAVLIGSNGAGKSTLLRTLAGIQKIHQGKVTIEGNLLPDLTPSERAERIAYQPQSFHAPFDFTVDEYIRLNNKHTGEEAEVVRVMDIDDLRHRPLRNLSGGERQRAAVGRALLTKAPFLLLDEPSAHLDLRYALRLWNHLRECAQNGAAILVAAHELSIVLPFANRLLLLTAGKITFDGPPRDLSPEDIERSLKVERELLPSGFLQGI